jgi:murein DD-endopeptidase MepM/ murein hydrolase activator NlpD
MSDRTIADALPTAFAINEPKPLGQAPTPAAERARVAELAKEFEAMLMLQMVKTMRQSMLDESAEGEGFGGTTMQETFDSEFSRYLAQSGGVGFGDFMLRSIDARNGEPVQARAASGETVSFALPAAALPVAAVSRSTDSADAPASGELPLANGVTSKFGWRADPLTGESRFHRGVDLRAAYGTEVPAAAGGTVVYAGERGTYGTFVAVRDAQGVETRYAHLSAALVKEGDEVAAGTPIGRVGSSGRSAAPHLHFEVLVNGERVDPARWAGRVGRGPLKSGDVAVD